MQGLVEHDGAALGLQCAQMLHAFGMFAWKESLIAEAVGRQAGQCERIQYGRGAGRAGDRQAAFDSAAHDGQSRIVDGRHARIGDDQHGGTGFDLVEQTVGLIPLVMVVIGDHTTGHMDAETVGERIQAARVFGRDDVGSFHERNQSGGGIGGIADRRCGKNHRTTRNADAVHQRIERAGGGNPAAVIHPVREFGWLLC